MVVRQVEFEDVIAKGLSEVTQTDLVEHEINLTSDIPIKCDERRTPLHLRSVFKKLLDEMLEAKVIQPSESAYSFPAFLVSKKLGGYRIVNSYEPLNAITIKDNYTVPLIPAMHAALKFATWMTTIDLLSGYYQVRIRDKDKHKSAFKTEFGLFEFTVLAMGLCNATATFQRLLEKILKEFLNIFVMVYIDDIVIYSETYEQHVIHTKLVLSKLRQAGLKIKWEKCEWAMNEITYLGFIIGNGQIRPSELKTKALFHYTQPKTKKQIHRFVGLVNFYRNFIENYAEVAAPLIKALDKKAKFKWSDELNTSFNYLREYLTTEKGMGRGIMLLPDLTKIFKLECDACNYGIGALLTQNLNGEWLPTGYYSKRLNSTEIKYATNEKELMALVMAMQHWRMYLLGRKFIAVTDHKPLKWIMSMAKPPQKLSRWLLTIGEFDFELQFRAGKENANADAMSRWLATEDEDKEGEEPTYNTDVVVNFIIKNKITKDRKSHKVVIKHINAIFLAANEFNNEQSKDKSINELKKWIEAGSKSTIKPSFNTFGFILIVLKSLIHIFLENII